MDLNIDDFLNNKENEIVPVINFEYFNKKVRTIYINGEIWFVAKDVAEILGYTNPRKAIIDHCKGSNELLLPSEGGMQLTKIIPESDVYRLIFKSKLPEAEKFEDWVTKEVLPSIRKTGKYEISGLENLTENERRRVIRDEIVKHNPIISAEAKRLGVGKTNDEKENSIQFAVFHNSGYEGLYNGLKVKDISKKRNLPKNAKVLDYMGSTELGANLFRITQAEELLKQQEDNAGIDKANNIHYFAGAEVRKAMIAIHGTPPEDLPTYEKLELSKSKDKKQIHKINKGIINKNYNSKIEINISTDLWKVALLIMAKNKDGIVLTNELMEEIHKYIEFPEKYKEISKIKNEPKYKQIIRNLKSNIKNKTNFVNQGYAISIKDGFQITQKGIDFIKEYFKDYL